MDALQKADVAAVEKISLSESSSRSPPQQLNRKGYLTVEEIREYFAELKADRLEQLRIMEESCKSRLPFLRDPEIERQERERAEGCIRYAEKKAVERRYNNPSGSSKVNIHP